MPQTSTPPSGGPVGRVVARLAALQGPDGGWPYEPGQRAGFTEPTCWTLLAMQAADSLPAATSEAGTAFLCSVQQADGGFHSGAADREANWSSTLAVLCLSVLGRESAAVRRGVEWLLGFEGWHDKDLGGGAFAHDTSLRGWPWLAGCHSWIEPTCYAIQALRSVGLGEHPRVEEAVRMVLDRALPGGGWNYGNTRVLGTELRAFPSTTGTALVTLAGVDPCPEARRGLRYLGVALPRLRTAWALGWTALAGRYYGFEAFESAEAIDVDERVAKCLEAQCQPSSRVRIHEMALLLMSAHGRERLPFRGAVAPAASAGSR